MVARLRTIVLALSVIAPSFAVLLQAAAAAPLAGIGGPMALTTNESGSFDPAGITVLEDGTAFLLYSKPNPGSFTDAYVSRYTPTGGWQPGVLIENNWTANAVPVDIKSDGRGNVYVAMLMRGAQEDVYVARYISGDGWWPPDLLDNQAGVAQTPSLSVASNGFAFVAWFQFDGTYYSTYARRLTPAGFWEPIVNIESLSADGFNNPSAGVDVYGNGVCVWNQGDGGANRAFANLYTQGSGWGTAAALDLSAGDTVTARVSMADDGRALAAWTHGANGTTHVYSKWYAPASGWGNLTDHATYSGNIQSAIPLTNDLWGGVVVWAQFASNGNSGWADHYSYAGGWDGAALFETTDEGLDNQFYHQQISADGAGNFLIAYSAWDGSAGNLHTALYLAEYGWRSALRADDTRESVGGTIAAVNGAGEGWVGWSRYNGTRTQLWVAKYQTPDSTPPTLDVSWPPAMLNVTEPTVRVTGNVYGADRLTVNGLVAEIAADDSFSILVPLAVGQNQIRVMAFDQTGNEAYAEAWVVFDDPTVALRDELDAALDDLAAATAQVDALIGQLASAETAIADAQTNVTAALAQVDALEASMTATQADLDAAEAALTSAQASLAGQLHGANTNATSAQNAATAAQAAATAAQAASTGQAATVTEAKASASSAFMVGLLGIVVGALGAAMAVMAMRRKPPTMGAAQSNPMYVDRGKSGENPMHQEKE